MRQLMTHWIYCWMLFVATSLGAGEILTTNDFSIIERESENLDTDSLVLFDVDGTIIVADDAILKLNGRKLFKQLIEGHTDRDLFRDIRMQAPHSLVDFRLINLIQQLQEKKIPTIAFTAAPAKIQDGNAAGDWRIEELKLFGFDFSTAISTSDSIELPNTLDDAHLPMFKSGVLFSSSHPKGNILVAFLQKTGLNPYKVLFIDDELKHVQSVVASLEKLGIECLGIHYTAAHDAPCELNPEHARFQVEYFIKHNVWLYDEHMALKNL